MGTVQRRAGTPPSVRIAPGGLGAQPISQVQWIERDRLHANAYNPNIVAPPELALLKTSILRSGWTQPIVIRRDYEVVDGYHRWCLSADPEIMAMTGGMVPVVFLAEVDPAEQMMATVRHNRARGTHYVLRMADIVEQLIDVHGLDPAQVEQLLSMEDEEVDRLHDRGSMTKRGSREEFNQGWAVL